MSKPAYVWDGASWVSVAGPQGPGVSPGGSTGQVLAKNSNDDYDTEWVDITASPSVNDLSDVTVSTPADNEFLAYDSTSNTWINQTYNEAGLNKVYYQTSEPSSPAVGDVWVDSDGAVSGGTVPPGGTTNQVLAKDSSTDYDTVWVDAEALPTQTGNSGELLVTDGTDASWSNTVVANSSSVPAIIAKGAVSQSANLQEWQNSSGEVITSINYAGKLSAYPIVPNNSVSAETVGYIGMPQVNNPSSPYTLSASDAGKHIYMTTTGRTVTIPANSVTALEIGTTVVIINGSGVTTTISINTDTLYLAGDGTTGSRTLAAFGMATLVKITSTSWIISGNGLS